MLDVRCAATCFEGQNRRKNTSLAGIAGNYVEEGINKLVVENML
jgi:hypothetical protein